MLTLALDTTTRAGSVAVTRDDLLLALVQGDASRTHGERLPEEIDRTLGEAGVSLRDLQLLVVGSGPGAFTGLRIGLAAIQGMAMVLGVPVVGVSALDALAATAWPLLESGEDTLVAWMDAQRREVFGACYVAAEQGAHEPQWQQRGVPAVGTPSQMFEAFDAPLPRHAVFVGDGAIRYRAEIQAWSSGRGRVVEAVPALAPALARLGRGRAARGDLGPPHALQPLYIRRPDVELERQRRIGP